ncbi:MAG TPA: precorrin-3B C(17)-methyltransferase, partial [Steroidobacteraceae bacterium]
MLHLVSVGPGTGDLIVPSAIAALRESEVIVSYELYLRWVTEWIRGKEIHTPPLTQERERARLAIDRARGGRKVALISSGDIGIYAMAALAFEEMREEDTFDVNVIPGITAANACASLLGSPLSHDFATLSLSNLMCPWEWIEQRARHIAEADLACVLYNVQSNAR